MESVIVKVRALISTAIVDENTSCYPRVSNEKEYYLSFENLDTLFKLTNEERHFSLLLCMHFEEIIHNKTNHIDSIDYPRSETDDFHDPGPTYVSTVYFYEIYRSKAEKEKITVNHEVID